MDKRRQTKAGGWEPPRGIRFVTFQDRPKPYGVQWRSDGKRKTKVFPTREKQIGFAKELSGVTKTHGLAALRLDEGEARDWRAFRAVVGGNTDLQAVAACWLKHREAMTRTPMTLPEAIAAYTTAKQAEGVSAAAVSHYGPIFDRLELAIGNLDVASITADHIAAFMAGQYGSHDTKRTRFARVRALFNWLVETNRLDTSPFRGMKPPKTPANEVCILTLDQTAALFAENISNEPGRRETLGRSAELGSVEVGKVADLVVLDADPLADITNLRRIHRVIHSGRVLDPAALLRLVPAR